MYRWIAQLALLGLVFAPPLPVSASSAPASAHPAPGEASTGSADPADPSMPAELHALVGAAGPGARVRASSAHRLALATHLHLELPGRDAAAVLDALLERFPEALPVPAGLTAHTQAYPLGNSELILRTWSWQGVPIEGMALSAHRNPRGQLTLISARGLRPGEPGLPSMATSPRWMPEDAAREAASQSLRQLLELPTLELRMDRGLEATASGLMPSWRASFVPPPPLLPAELRLHGTTGQALSLHRRAATEQPHDPAERSPGQAGNATPSDTRDAMGDVYLDSALDGLTADASLPDLLDPVYLTGLWTRVYNYIPQGAQQVQTALPTTSDASRYDYPPIETYASGYPTTETQSDLFAEVMMYHHVNRVHSYFNSLGYDNADPSVGIDRQMSATVNYRSRSGYYDNAYYSLGTPGGTVGQMVFGQGEATDFTYDSSVIYHEYGHAVVNGTSNYSLGCTPDVYGSDCTEGGLNEGTADYFSSSLRGDALVGAYAMGEWLPSYVRDLRDPNRCPDDLYGEVHEDGRIWGAALWDIRTSLAGSDSAKAQTRVDPLILAAVATTLPDASGGESALSYAADILEGVIDSAVSSGSLSSTEQTMVQQALAARGLISCKRFVPLASGRAKSGAFSSNALPLPNATSAAGLQYTVEVPDGATQLSFAVSGISDVVLYANLGHPVEYSASSGVPSADYVFTGSSFLLNKDSGLEPGIYYITFTSKQTLVSALYGYYYEVKADLGGTFSPSETSGCACVQGPNRPSSSASAGTVFLIVGVMWGLKRRRRAPTA